MRWLFGLTVVVLTLSLAWSAPQQEKVKGKPEGVTAPKQAKPNEGKARPATDPAHREAQAAKEATPEKAPPGSGSGYRPGSPGYPYMPNPYGPYPGMNQPYGMFPSYGYPPSGMMGYGMMGYGGSMGYGGYRPYGGMGYGMMGYGGNMGYGAMGYGGYSPYAMNPPPPAPTSEAEVAIYDNYFEPRTVYVTPGGKVRWTNKGKHLHTVRGFAGDWGSKDIKPGKSYTFTLPEALNHHYYCTYHPLEMTGYIVVRPPLPMPPQGQGQGGYTKSGY